MKNLYWKRIYMKMNDGQQPILNWSTQLVYCPDPPDRETMIIKDATEFAVAISRHYVNGSIKRGIFNNRIKKFHLEDMRDWYGCNYKPEKISFPVSRETIYNPLDYDMSFKRLSEELPAEDFIRWMKDNGMNTCPMIK
nr:MAG TPA: hypothetical protein [Caudoviricetes sp.]